MYVYVYIYIHIYKFCKNENCKQLQEFLNEYFCKKKCIQNKFLSKTTK